jgi:hypothetical protein
MKVFHCDHCGQLVFFENTSCVSCGRTLAYLPDIATVGSLDACDDGRWRSPVGPGPDARYRLCANYTQANVCNWALPDEESGDLCRSCRLTEVIPDVSDSAAREAWHRLEVAKRRLLVTLMSLRLPVDDRMASPAEGLAFHFKADPVTPDEPPVLTGHNEGLITINIAEADDAERERRRRAMHEPYRTLLGHMRHESGHYYWNRLVRGTAELDGCRAFFGDDTRDYADALRVHYEQGAPPDWSSRFVSAYASAHPWEDWAETWAHYLHMFDTLETAAACGVSLRPKRRDEPALTRAPDPAAAQPVSFDRLIDSWFSLTYMLNNLNRGLGAADPYPFVLSTPAIDKLRFVHELIERAAIEPPGARQAADTAPSVRT